MHLKNQEFLCWKDLVWVGNYGIKFEYQPKSLKIYLQQRQQRHLVHVIFLKNLGSQVNYKFSSWHLNAVGEVSTKLENIKLEKLPKFNFPTSSFEVSFWTFQRKHKIFELIVFSNCTFKLRISPTVGDTGLLFSLDIGVPAPRLSTVEKGNTETWGSYNQFNIEFRVIRITLYFSIEKHFPEIPYFR